MWLINSSVGRKFIMGITGGFLVLFLLFHSIMNIVVVFSDEAYNAVVGFLGANWYAIIGTLVIAGGAVLHILYALLLSIQNYIARGKERYAVTKKQEGVTWASKNMLILGVIIVGFLILHLIQFWSKMQLVELTHWGDVEKAVDGAYWVRHYMSNPWYAVIYMICFVALWFHLTHGIWSAFQSMGLNNKKWLKRWKTISYVVATVIVGLFMAIPIYFQIINIFGL